jgi:cytochrome c oxidase subunit 2
MMEDFPFFPEQASTIAGQIDGLYFLLVGLSFLFAIPVAILIIFFTIRYKREKSVNRSNPVHASLRLELLWSVIPFLLSLGVFGWGAWVYFGWGNAPADTLDIYIIGKQWMWQAQHPSGKREINNLHIPVNQPVKLIMTSQDVIHSYYIPDFRIKQDVLPGRYTTLWFEANKTGDYHLFCAEYCGTDHSRMTGTITVMNQLDYQRWLSGDTANQPLAEAGQQLFTQHGCNSCHSGEPDARGPTLAGLFGEEVRLQNGQTVVADEPYLRESILQPQAKIVAGYPPIMPTFQDILGEEEIIQLIAYIKSLEEDQEGREQGEALEGNQPVDEDQTPDEDQSGSDEQFPEEYQSEEEDQPLEEAPENDQ